MVGKKTKSKTLNYRKAEITDESKTLHSLLVEAMRRLPKPEDRSEELGKEEVYRLINQFKHTEQLFFGQFVLYEKDASQPILSRNVAGNSSYYPLKYLSMKDVPKEFSGRGADFVNSILYFAVYGNHVILAPSQQVTIGAFEKYLSWLLGVQSGVLKVASSFSLQNKIFKRKMDELPSPIVSMEVGGALNLTGDSEDSTVAQSSSKGALTIQSTSQFQVGIQVLKSLIKSLGEDSSRWSSLLEGENVSAKIVVTSSSNLREIIYLSGIFRSF